MSESYAEHSMAGQSNQYWSPDFGGHPWHAHYSKTTETILALAWMPLEWLNEWTFCMEGWSLGSLQLWYKDVAKRDIKALDINTVLERPCCGPRDVGAMLVTHFKSGKRSYYMQQKVGCHAWKSALTPEDQRLYTDATLAPMNGCLSSSINVTVPAREKY